MASSLVAPKALRRGIALATALAMPMLPPSLEGQSPVLRPAAASGQRLRPDSLPIRLPQADLKLTIGGYAKVSFIQDFDAIGDTDEFKINTIPVDGTPAADLTGRTTVHARESRVNLEVKSGTGFRAFVEGDFFGSGNAFRLRHAYGEYKRLLGGQTWSTFQDISARPLTLDFEGPDAEVFVRQAMIKWTQPLSKNWSWATAVENPGPDFAVPSTMTGVAKSSAPDLASHLRVSGARGHVQLAGIVRQIRFDGQGTSEDLSELGYGANATFSLKTFGKDQLLGEIMAGEGVARYIEGFNGQHSDAVITTAGGISTLPVTAFVLGYTRHWNDRFKSGASFATAEVTTDASQAGSAIERIRDARVNLIYSPIREVEFGGEFLWGRRDNRDGGSGEARRVMFAVTYYLH
jgi:hypothetical protein